VISGGAPKRNFISPGFRDGSEPAKQKVLAKALESAKPNAGGLTWLAVGPLYVKAVRLHIEHNAPSMYQLLRTEDFVAGAGSQTEQIFRCICRALPMHDASIAEAKELYELWGFERTPQIEEILSSVSIRADDVRRMVAESLSTTRREIASAVATTRSDLMRHLEKQSNELGTLARALDRLQAATSDTASQISEFRSEAKQRQVAVTANPQPKTDYGIKNGLRFQAPPE